MRELYIIENPDPSSLVKFMVYERETSKWARFWLGPYGAPVYQNSFRTEADARTYIERRNNPRVLE